MNDNAEIPQGDLISRAALKAKMFDIPKPKEGVTFWDGVDTVGNLIDNAQAIDISGNEYSPFRTAYFNGVEDGRATARLKGEWINHRNDSGHNIADCSLCGKTMQWHDEDEEGVPRYCWYCGAKMKGGE